MTTNKKMRNLLALKSHCKMIQDKRHQELKKALRAQVWQSSTMAKIKTKQSMISYLPMNSLESNKVPLNRFY